MNLDTLRVAAGEVICDTPRYIMLATGHSLRGLAALFHSIHYATVYVSKAALKRGQKQDKKSAATLHVVADPKAAQPESEVSQTKI